MKIFREKRTLAILLCIALVYLAIFSTCHFHHDNGDEGFGVPCPVCTSLKLADHPIEPAGFMQTLPFSLISGAIFLLIPLCAGRILLLSHATPISQKTRMNN